MFAKLINHMLQKSIYHTIKGHVAKAGSCLNFLLQSRFGWGITLYSARFPNPSYEQMWPSITALINEMHTSLNEAHLLYLTSFCGGGGGVRGHREVIMPLSRDTSKDEQKESETLTTLCGVTAGLWITSVSCCVRKN